MDEFFIECTTCAAQPGTPVLCPGCLHNRRLIESLKDERNSWQGRAMALFYGGKLDEVTCGEIRTARAAYTRWLRERG